MATSAACRHRAAAAVLAAAVLASCGYRVLDPSAGGGRRIAVPTATNETRWRGAEADLTGLLRRDLQRQLDLELGGTRPDLYLITEIREGFRSAPVLSASGGAALGASHIQVSWRLEDASHAVLDEGTLVRSIEFLPSESETARTAITEILDSMAENVVVEVGARLADRQVAEP